MIELLANLLRIGSLKSFHTVNGHNSSIGKRNEIVCILAHDVQIVCMPNYDEQSIDVIC